MRISVKGRNLPVTDELREQVTRRFNKVARQVSELAELEVELYEERNPAIPESQVAEATLHLKRVTLRARDASTDMPHAINLASDQLAKQVKRHREKLRRRREARAASATGSERTVLVDDSDVPESVVEGILLDPDGDQPADVSAA